MLQAPYLEITELEKRFDDFVALNDISLQINEGEFVCFLGPSGCGKTTLLRTIAGLEQAQQGRIIQGGKDITHLPTQHRDFGIVFQSYALFPNLTVADNIAYGLVNNRLSRQERAIRVAELLAQIDLPGIEEKFPGQLSGGQQQRVALARALAIQPGLLLLDEPLSALDARVRLHLRKEICELQRSLGITTVMVTHDQDEALTMADRIVVMDHGTIAQTGTPQEIYHHPATEFVARFIGSMNLLPSRFENNQKLVIEGTELSYPLCLDQEVSEGKLGFRPERVRVVPAELGLPPKNLGLRGAVQKIVFMGALVRLEVRLAIDVDIEVDMPGHQYAEQQPAVGDIISLLIDEQDLHFYPKATDAQAVPLRIRDQDTSTTEYLQPGEQWSMLVGAQA
ncbi:putative 2-aminoethylphosphonate ABC transporter ATP-binding protein [Aestuariirhabdus sp. Z084]|uniref:putative 2-aminoethylphosphonate ABC transporter ATP-binding protein n=1 Tax=Aestuariirhabdus haliotis TaxID=2918751 RepID=UPI00201B3D33|nr:putative 2-aminoethylphosphonate ABC transporter ATP-binding protein [Aestuariirhabdus haliotis]MCL6416942.1 putative 2-aminoethylphosphonate ABC transporter ATP-binding protein [Aestuariirhabdus haliotis]MCL6420955.1 putative 2-aminoethylphosphonate ABC transporter ATP-binding protein [Aestuariirhabdus haliotis]